MNREGQQQQPNIPLQLTPEEQQVLKECRNDSFWKRCLPISFSFAAMVHMAVQRGMLKPHARFGSIPKVGISVFLGYIVGKISYKSECEKKIMTQIPNSNLARLIGSRGQSPLSPFAAAETYPGQPAAVPQPPAAYQQRSAEEKSASFDFDTFNSNMRSNDISGASASIDYVTGDFDSFNRNTRSDVQRRSMQDFDAAPPPSALSDSGQSHTTYDDLRRRNRDEYDRKQQASRAPPPQSQRSGGGGNSFDGNPQFDGLDENQSTRRRF